MLVVNVGKHVHVAPFNVDPDLGKVQLRHMRVDIVKECVCGSTAISVTRHLETIGRLLVAPRPWKKLNLDSGPASRSGTCPKNFCNSAAR